MSGGREVNLPTLGGCIGVLAGLRVGGSAVRFPHALSDARPEQVVASPPCEDADTLPPTDLAKTANRQQKNEWVKFAPMTEYPQSDKREWLVFILLFLAGAGIRLVQFFHCRSLWVDEASVSLNIINRSYLDLLLPLGYHQQAPVGFLWVSRFLVNLFGPNEFALRGYSLICGIASLPVYFLVARRLYCAKVAWLALGLLAFLPSMVRYSNEAKQYMGDVLWAGLLILATQNALNGTGIRRWIIIFIVGSYPCSSPILRFSFSRAAGSTCFWQRSRDAHPTGRSFR
jgi:hypothetical protein